MDLDEVLDQLGGLGDVHARPMFGGYGLYHRGVFFAIHLDGRLYFHTDDETRTEYVERGMEPFVPRPGAGPFRYFEVPADILGDPVTARVWAERALASRPPESKRSARRRGGASCAAQRRC